MINIGELILLIEKRPGIGVGDKRIDYLFHYLTGRSDGNKNIVDKTFRSTFPQYIHEWIVRNIDNDISETEFSFYWYKMIYRVTTCEQEAWDLFFQIAHDFFSQIDIKE